MIEMDMGQHHPVDRLRCHPETGERRQHPRYRRVAAGVDDGGTATVDDQMDGRELRPAVAGIDRMDAVRMGG